MLSLPKAILQWVAACLCLFLLVLYLTSDWTSYRSLHLPSYTLSKNDYYDLVNDSTAFQSFLPGSNEITPYPSLFPLGELLQDWHPLHTHLQAFSRSKAHPSRKAGLYRFNFQDPAQLQMAFEMRDKDLPFVIYNVPSLDNAAMHAFSHVNLLEEIGSSQFVVEESNCNEFTYYFVKNEQVVRARFPTWSAPQTSLSMTFMDYVHLAEEKESSHKASQFNEKYHYLTISAEKEGNLAWIADSLRLFDPVDSLFMNSQEPYRGIKCRLGMKGVIATAHFDSKKNFVAMVRGQKRYVLLPPEECQKLKLHPRGHPSARHSSVAWHSMSELKKHPDLYSARATEVVLRMGEALYIPSYWFHYIISQDASIQCNARSGEAMPISYYDQFIGNDWARYSKIMGKVATLSCFAFGLIDLILGISTLAALWTILAGFVLAIWEIPFIFILFPRFKEFQTYLLENCYVKFEETKAAVCLFLGLFCFTHFGFTTLAGIVLLMTAVAFACAAVNRRADEAAGLRRDSTPFEYPEDMKWGGGGVDQPQTTQSLLSAASKFGTF